MHGEREEQRALYRRLSTTQYAARATTPTLILQGADDERCPRSQSEELLVTLKRGRNPPCELVLYPQGTHQFTSSGKPTMQQDAMRRIVDWLERWVEPGQDRQPTRAPGHEDKPPTHKQP